MNKLEFNKVIKEFVLLDFPIEGEVIRIELTIKFFKGEMGDGVTFSGEYIFGDNKSLPIDFRKVNKIKCRALVDSSKLFYNQYLLDSVQPCNVIKIEVLEEGNNIQYFYSWDVSLN